QMAGFGFDVFTADCVRSLCFGKKLVMCPEESLLAPEKLYGLMRQHAVDCAEFVPVVLRALLSYLKETHQNLRFMRLLIVGSAICRVDEHRQLESFCGPATRLINSYGMTEATVDSLYFDGAVDGSAQT